MKEALFIKQRAEHWQKLEQAVKSGEQKDPDELASLFIELTDDLAYARTFYPKSKTTEYLNNLLLFVHKAIYRNKKEKSSRFRIFWLQEVPLNIYLSRKAIYLSCTIFMLSALIGIFSLSEDAAFVRMILGDEYVNLTVENIKKGDPMGIYSSSSQLDMFVRITINNIKVSFFAFASGLLTAIATGIILFSNGMMLGTFQYYFFTEGMLGISAQAIWIHGVIEISSILIAGGAGILLGNSFVFPGSLSRKQSFINKGRQGAKLVLGLVPLFVIAGLLESFITRYYKNQILSIGCIILSLLFIGWYFIYLPYRMGKLHGNRKA